MKPEIEVLVTNRLRRQQLNRKIALRCASQLRFTIARYCVGCERSNH